MSMQIETIDQWLKSANQGDDFCYGFQDETQRPKDFILRHAVSLMESNKVLLFQKRVKEGNKMCYYMRKKKK